MRIFIPARFSGFSAPYISLNLHLAKCYRQLYHTTPPPSCQGFFRSAAQNRAATAKQQPHPPPAPGRERYLRGQRHVSPVVYRHPKNCKARVDNNTRLWYHMGATEEGGTRKRLHFKEGQPARAGPLSFRPGRAPDAAPARGLLGCHGKRDGVPPAAKQQPAPHGLRAYPFPPARLSAAPVPFASLTPQRCRAGRHERRPSSRPPP